MHISANWISLTSSTSVTKWDFHAPGKTSQQMGWNTAAWKAFMWWPGPWQAFRAVEHSSGLWDLLSVCVICSSLGCWNFFHFRGQELPDETLRSLVLFMVYSALWSLAVAAAAVWGKDLVSPMISAPEIRQVVGFGSQSCLQKRPGRAVSCRQVTLAPTAPLPSSFQQAL